MGSKPPALGVIDSLSAGFEAVNRNIWILLFPLALDLFLWLGAPLSMAPIARRALDWYERVASGPFAEVAVQSGGTDPLRQVLEGLGGDFNLFRLLVLGLANVPSAVTSPLNGFDGAAQVSSVLALIGVVIGLGAVGAFIGCLYLGALAQQVRDGRVDLGKLRRRVWFYWLSVLGYGLMMLALAIGAGIASSVLIAVGTIVSQQLGMALAAMTMLVWWGCVFVLLLFTFFLVDAIVVNEVGPWRALLNSARVVSQNTGASVGLIFLLWIIAGGTQVIWGWLPNQTWGTLAAILANAYIGSGLAAASLAFYQSRFARLSGSGRQSAKRLA